MTSPTTRTLDYLRERGWRCWIVEKWNAHSRIRVDAWGFGDILAFRGAMTALVQATSGANVAARQAKIDTIETAREWREPNRTVLVVGWRKLKGRGRRQWFPLVRELKQDGGWDEWPETPALLREGAEG